MAFSVLKMKCIAITIHSQLHSKEFPNIAANGEKPFTVFFNDITLFETYLWRRLYVAKLFQY